MDFRISTRSLAIVLAGLVSACAAPMTQRGSINDAAVELEAEKQREYAVRQLVKDYERLHAVGLPILKAGLPLCEDKTSWGINAFIVNQYDFAEEMRDTASKTFDLGNALTLLHIFPGPAQEAGLQAGDTILAINDKEAPVGQEASTKFGEMFEAEVGESGQPFTLAVDRNGAREEFRVQPIERCDYPIALHPGNEINAFADGDRIVIYKGMLDFTNNDDELALVLAHELAHNNMGHIGAKTTNAIGGLIVDILIAAATGVNTQGAVSKAAAGAYSQEFEQEADYVGLYILARAGREIEDAPLFWRRMGARKPDSIAKNFQSTHPSSAERFVLLEETIAEIEHKQEVGVELTPNIKATNVSADEKQAEEAPKL